MVQTFFELYTVYIVGNPPPPSFNKGKTFQKLSHLGGKEGYKFFARKGGQTWKGGVKIEMRGLPFFYYFTVQSH